MASMASIDSDRLANGCKATVLVGRHVTVTVHRHEEEADNTESNAETTTNGPLRPCRCNRGATCRGAAVVVTVVVNVVEVRVENNGKKITGFVCDFVSRLFSSFCFPLVELVSGKLEMTSSKVRFVGTNATFVCTNRRYEGMNLENCNLQPNCNY